MNISVLIIGSPSLDHLVINGDSHHVAGGLVFTLLWLPFVPVRR